MFQANSRSFAVRHLAKDGFWLHVQHAAYGSPQIALKTLCESQLLPVAIYGCFIWMIYLDALYIVIIYYIVVWFSNVFISKFRTPCLFHALPHSHTAPPSDHKAASLCMESLHLPFGSVEVCSSRTLQSKDGHHLWVRNHTDHTLTYLDLNDLIWFERYFDARINII